VSQAAGPGPIAIVGQSCVLPGALRPEELWAHIEAGEDLLTQAPADRWGIDRDLILFPRQREPRDAMWSDRGGYVKGFASVFDPGGFAVDAEQLLPLDPLFHWVLHGGREALRDAGHDTERPSPRVGAVIGNLSFPSRSLAAWAESVWCSGWPGREEEAPHPRNRFMSGLPAHLLAEALRLEEGAFALDAACASSLYAIKLACDRLHDGQADLMLAGAVNRADDLFIHVGFCALQAMSRSGRSRPFHREADGLVPAEGAAFVVLKRLADAEAAGDRVLGVIRSIGLSNDGRGSGLLAPSAEGQVRAMRLAYQQAGFQPSEISLVECHATGTPVGDGVELQSTAEVFAGSEAVPIGSLKSNLGHLITAAGTAGLLKLLGALRTGIRPATLNAEAPLRALASSPFRLLATNEPWSCPGPRRAALSAFGFGGNNAHLILEEAGASRAGSGVRVAVGLPSPPIVIVGLGVIAADALGTAAFTEALLRGESRLRPGPDPERETGHTDEVALDADGLRFPPLDLEKALAQQTLLLAAAREAVDQAGPLPRERTAVLAGMQTDAEVARFGARWRAAQWARQAAPASAPTPEGLERLRDSIVRPLDAPGVVGTMPNIVANRLNSQLDLAGPSLTVSAEEISGLRALEVAVRALRAGEVDAALVGAVDVSAEPAHGRAAAAVLPASCQPAGDAAVALVLKREEDALRDGNQVLATVDPAGGDAELLLGSGPEAIGLTGRFGHAHAASGLLHLAAATLACRYQVRPPIRTGHGAAPWLGASERLRAGIEIDALGEARCRIGVVAPTVARPLALERPRRVLAFCGADTQEVLSRLRNGVPSRDGAVRLTIVAGTEEETQARIAAAREALSRGDRPDAEGVYYRTAPVGGELAFVFTGPAGAYRGMAGDLLMALPGLTDAVRGRFRRLGAAVGWAYTEADGEPAAVDKLWGASFLCQAHAELSSHWLGLRPDAAIGFCSGETNALFALGAWEDLDDLHDQIEIAGVYSRELAAECRVPQRAWGMPGARFVSYRVLCPLPQVQEALEGEARCHLTIVNAPGDAVIGGEAEACRRVVARLGPERARPLGYDIAVHCPEMELFRDEWRRLHHRPTRPVPGVRFYTHATGSHYRPDSDSAAEALVGQALQTVDFPRLIQNAWEDGVRVFLEHGPQSGCSRWIERILGDREHVAVPLDLPGRSSLEQLAHTRARLIVAGVELRDTELEDRLEAATLRPSRGSPRQLRFRVHRPQPARPSDGPRTRPAEEAASGPDGFQSMPPAPELPPVISKGAALVTPTEPASPPGPVPDGLRELVTQQARLSALHREFLEEQSALHRSFLAVRARPPATQAGAAWQPPVAAPRPPEPPAEPPPSPQGQSHAPSGLRLSRQQLEIHASGPISSIFGPPFEQQDGYRRQVRMPEPPLLLADRVTGITGEPGTLGLGKVFTETDVGEDAWYLHEGRMPAGVMIEAGQADLLLISWLGIDFLNRGERVYRLLGCELTYHGGLPRAGETLAYEIEVDGHAQQDAVRLFFFHYDCRVDGRPRLSVRGGQAGFFTDEELAETSGVLWEAESAEHDKDARLDPPVVPEVPGRLDHQQLEAMAAGRIAAALGPGFERAASHVQSPRIPPGRLLLLQRVDEIDPAGGPWGRGYLRATWDFSASDWFFDGHFKNDPCMPGTLMFEGCLSAMAVYLTALGFTLDKDGWRFEPVPDEVCRLRCRGQAVPSSRQLTYELFVEEVQAGPEPTLFADLLCTVDGVKAFHARRMGLRLVPDWPLTRRPELLAEAEPAGPAVVVEGHRFDHRSLLACAWDRPSLAFGELYRAFDGPRHLPRLPAPPYQFMTRVTSFQGELGSMRPGGVVEAEYRVPDQDWYFAANGSPTMPFCVLLEAHLQPCGWLALATGIPRATEQPLYFRNLDGTGTLTREVPPGNARLRTRTRLTGLSASGGMYLVSFDVEGHLDDEPIFHMSTGFGFFPAAALLQQVGLPRSDPEPGGSRPGDDAPGLEGRGDPVVARPPLLMLDRVVSYAPAGGKAGLGRLWAQKDVDPGEWFFRAHFYQDPVQPGSLGLEAILQLLKVYMLERGLDRGIANPRFEPLALGRELTWKYRGQVLPRHRRVSVELEVNEVRRDSRGPLAVAQGWLWVDGTCIYHAQGLALRLVPGPAGG
jgi:acyl transferase domain-containing protein/3-hydroxymyristoyl/3-hydroxydecanoyl-(acyl carrier protein) dehydratase